MKTFLAECANGNADPQEIHDWVTAWHILPDVDVELHEYLGMSWDEYASWVACPEIIYELVEERCR